MNHYVNFSFDRLLNKLKKDNYVYLLSTVRIEYNKKGCNIHNGFAVGLLDKV